MMVAGLWQRISGGKKSVSNSNEKSDAIVYLGHTHEDFNKGFSSRGEERRWA